MSRPWQQVWRHSHKLPLSNIQLCRLQRWIIVVLFLSWTNHQFYFRSRHICKFCGFHSDHSLNRVLGVNFTKQPSAKLQLKINLVLQYCASCLLKMSCDELSGSERAPLRAVCRPSLPRPGSPTSSHRAQVALDQQVARKRQTKTKTPWLHISWRIESLITTNATARYRQFAKIVLLARPFYQVGPSPVVWLGDQLGTQVASSWLGPPLQL